MALPPKKTAPKTGSKCERPKPQPVERRAYSIAEFCEAYHISQDHYFKLRKAGKGPREMKLGAKILITVRSAEEWEIEMENDTASEEREEDAAVKALEAANEELE